MKTVVDAAPKINTSPDSSQTSVGYLDAEPQLTFRDIDPAPNPLGQGIFVGHGEERATLTGLDPDKILESYLANSAGIEPPTTTEHTGIMSSSELLRNMEDGMESMSPEERQEARLFGERLIRRYFRPVNEEPVIDNSDEVTSYSTSMSHAATLACYLIARDILQSRTHYGGDDGASDNTLLEAYKHLQIAKRIHADSVARHTPNNDDNPFSDWSMEQEAYQRVIRLEEQIMGTDPETISAHKKERAHRLELAAEVLAEIESITGSPPRMDVAERHIPKDLLSEFFNSDGNYTGSSSK